MNMRRPAAVALLIACAVTIAVSAAADDQASRPLSRIPPIERFVQAALDAQSEFVGRMPSALVFFGPNGAVSRITGMTGIVLKTGLAGFKVGEPAKELLEKIGPALLAAGTEELRVFRINTEAATADPASPERTIKMRQYIGGREVVASAVNISLNHQTNEVTALLANFLPDRGLPHEPKLTAVEARAKVEAAMRDSALEEAQRITFSDTAPRLAYGFEKIDSYGGGVGGVLVWVFPVRQAVSGQLLEAGVSASTGEVIWLHSAVSY
jgi:hypothetical protein